MDFGLMFFSSTSTETAGAADDKYALLKHAVQFADTHGLCCVWTPERHFHAFGGLYPNPALTTCALAMMTTRIQLRAGSLVAPLHDPIRIAEDWSVADNLSRGRVAVSFGSGWNAEDFVLAPERYADRRRVMYEHIDVVQRLWRGDAVMRLDPFGHPVAVHLHPRPIQPALPVWITASSSPETFVQAGAIGANLLTHLIAQDVAALAERIAAYRAARADHGFPAATGVVSVMLHTFIGDDVQRVRDTVRQPLHAYLRSAVELERRAAAAGGTISGGKRLSGPAAPSAADDEMLDLAFDRYFRRASLMGMVETCHDLVLTLEDIGVNEIACLIDFGVSDAEVVASLSHIGQLADAFGAAAARH